MIRSGCLYCLTNNLSNGNTFGQQVLPSKVILPKKKRFNDEMRPNEQKWGKACVFTRYECMLKDKMWNIL